MSDTNHLMLSIGPVSLLVRVDRESKRISEAQLRRTWEHERAKRALDEEERRRAFVGPSVDGTPGTSV